MGEHTGSFNSELVSGSLEEDGNDDLLELDFLQRFDSEDIRDLRQFFFDGDPEEERSLIQETHRPNDRSLQYAGYGGKPLNKNQFISAVNTIVGSTACSLSASKLFHVLDSSNRGVVWWEEVLDHVIQHITLDVGGNTWTPLDTRVLLPDTPHCQRETIMKVVPIETKTSFCYAIITKFGRVGVYDGHLELHDSYMLQMRYGDPAFSLEGENKRRINRTWVTDGVFLPDAEALMIVSSNRAIHLYDCSGLIHAPLCHVAGLKNVPLCLAYSPGATGTASILFIGDDKGGITTLTFLQPKVSLFRKKHPDKLDKYYWMEIETQNEWVRLRVDPLVHRDAVCQVAYFPDNQTLVSCSQDPLATLVIRHISAKRTPYIFRLARGIRCFHLERTMRLLATGSNDCVVRLWNPVVTKEPTVSLFGHKTAVVDVLVLRHMTSVLSCSRDGVLKVWDIDDLCCIQTLQLNFPSFSVLGKRIEFGTRSFYPGPSSGKPAVSTISKGESETEPLPPPSISTTSHTTEDVRDNPSEPCVNVWTRDKLLVACCNNLALLHLQPRELGGGSRPSTPSPLPPPSREHRAAVPSPWEVTDPTTSSRSTPVPSPRHLTMPESTYQGGDELGSPACSRRGSDTGTTLRSLRKHSMPSRSRRGSDLETTLGSPRSEHSLSARSRRASKMLEAAPDREFKQRRPAQPSKGLHSRRVYHKQKMKEAQTYVEQCAPHLALQLWKVDAISFSRPLPVTTRMRERGVDVSDPERLMKARMKSLTSLSLTASGSLTSGSPSGRSSQSLVTNSRKIFSPDCFKH